MTVLKRYRLSILLVLIIISTNITTSAEGNQSHMNDSGFNIDADNMIVNGKIIVKDQIEISLSLSPDDNMGRMMNGHMGSENAHMDEYTNEMGIRIYELIEYEDTDQNGYGIDDKIISNYKLNETTLDQPYLIQENGKSSYIISDKQSEVFNMIIDINTENDTPYAIKWSFDIQYPFVQNNTNLAIINEIQSPDKAFDVEHVGMNSERVHSMRDGHGNIPMEFSWTDDVIVDGKTYNITSTVVNDYFVLSMIQGKNIIYDPSIAYDPVDLINLNDFLERSFNSNFRDSILSPNLEDLIIAFVILSIIIVISIDRNITY